MVPEAPVSPVADGIVPERRRLDPRLHGFAARGLCTVEEFVAQAGERRGLTLGAVEITPAGKAFLARMILHNESKTWFNQVVWGVTQYACRDVGHGIVLSQAHLESAMAAGDFDILRLCVDPDDLEYIFTAPTGIVVTDEDRLRRAAEWSSNFTRRCSATVHRVEWEIGEPLHLEDDADHDDPLDVAETFVDRKP